MSRRYKVIINDFYCTCCGSKGIGIPRVVGKQRESGHLKKIYCLKCQKETNHVECRELSHYEYPDFLFEFENGNFSETGDRKMPYGEFKHYIEFGKKEKEKELDKNEKLICSRRSPWDW